MHSLMVAHYPGLAPPAIARLTIKSVGPMLGLA